LVKRVLRKLRDTFRSLAGGEGEPPATPPRAEKFVEHKPAPASHASRPDTFQPGDRPAQPPRDRHGHRGPPRRRSDRPRHAPPREPGERRDTPEPDAVPLPASDWDPASVNVPPKEGFLRFQDLQLPNELLHAIADLGFQYCTPIQAEIMPKTLAGQDAAGQAQTGTGKTAAFLITIFNQFLRNPRPGSPRPGTPRALILAPTRELALQIEKDAVGLGKYCPFRIVAVFGGMDYEKQKRRLEGTVDVVIATPGRLLDFKRQHKLHLNQVEVLIIDEADRMLDMGFIPDVRDIVYSTPPKDRRQTMFFSATLTPDVKRLAASWTRNAVSVEIQPDQKAASSVQQVVYITTISEKFTLLYNMLKRYPDQPILVFGNRRDETQDLVDKLRAYGITCALLSGAVAQEKRIKTLEGFRAGSIRVVVATDVAGRGLHVEGISHVINYNLPEDPEDYVHRIGRTGRAGATGTSISFACEEDSFYIPEIEKFLGTSLACTYPEDDLLTPPPPPAYQPAARRDRRGSSGGPRPLHRGGRRPPRGDRRGGRPPRR
jgi:ATP-dependent RNA helicase RhlB